MLEQPLVLLATGGTGGHIFPAVAAAHALQTRGFRVAMIGGTNGMEAEIAARENIPFFGVRTGKLDRQRPDPRALLQALLGFKDAFGIVGQTRPSCVLGFGGFASFPGVIAGAFRGVPLVLHEANAVGGLVTRVASPFAKKIATAFAHVEALPAHKLVQVGMPVREVRLERNAALAALHLPNDPRPLVLVMGGSQGSVKFNALLPALLERILEGRDIQVLHQTGRGRLQEVTSQTSHLPWYHAAEFVDGPAAFSATSFAITRAGSSTIADAAFHGVPLLMVPLPSAADDQQSKNAQAVAALGAGLVVTQHELEHARVNPHTSAHALGRGMLQCLDEAALAQMRSSAQRNSPEGAASRLADVVASMMDAKASA